MFPTRTRRPMQPHYSACYCSALESLGSISRHVKTWMARAFLLRLPCERQAKGRVTASLTTPTLAKSYFTLNKPNDTNTHKHTTNYNTMASDMVNMRTQILGKPAFIHTSLHSHSST